MQLKNNKPLTIVCYSVLFIIGITATFFIVLPKASSMHQEAQALGLSDFVKTDETHQSLFDGQYNVVTGVYPINTEKIELYFKDSQSERRYNDTMYDELILRASQNDWHIEEEAGYGKRPNGAEISATKNNLKLSSLVVGSSPTTQQIKISSAYTGSVSVIYLIVGGLVGLVVARCGLLLVKKRA